MITNNSDLVDLRFNQFEKRLSKFEKNSISSYSLTQVLSSDTAHKNKYILHEIKRYKVREMCKVMYSGFASNVHPLFQLQAEDSVFHTGFPLILKIKLYK